MLGLSFEEALEDLAWVLAALVLAVYLTTEFLHYFPV